MRRTKIVLIFQAVVTLILGLIFFFQVLTINAAQLSELKNREDSPLMNESSPEIINLKQRYTAAAYILVFVGLIELAIIIKLIS